MQRIILLFTLGFHFCLFAQDKSNESNNHEHITGTRHLKDNRSLDVRENSPLSEALGVQDYFTLSGNVGLYYQTHTDKDEDLEREEFGNAYTFLKLETVEWNNLQFGIAGLFNGEYSDHNNSFERHLNEKSPILAELYAEYTLSDTTFTVGRQNIEWIMLEDYFEGVFVESSEVDGFTLRAAWANRMATLDPDDLITWNEFNADDDGHSNDTDGIYAAELEWNQLDNFTLTAVYYRSNGTFSIYGSRAEFLYSLGDKINNDLLVEFYKTRENGSFDNGINSNGSMFHISHASSYKGYSFGFGFAQAARTSGAGNLLNNPWDVFDEDTHMDLPNSTTWYLSTGYNFSEDLSLAALYGISHTDEGDNEDADYKEFNFIVTYAIYENLDLEAAYVKLDTDDGVTEGYDKVWFNLIYSF